MAKTDILVIDDDPDLCELIDDALSDDYKIHTCTEASKAIAMVEKINPPIILLDINLPNENGLRLCKEFSKQGLQGPLTLLISGDNSLELRLDAYNQGGADFLAKPFKITELRTKVDALNHFYLHHAQIRLNKEHTPDETLNAMVEALQYGEVLRFYNDIFDAESIEDIKDCFFKLMGKFGLQCSLQFRVEDTYNFDNIGNNCSPIEQQIYDNLHETERFVPFSNRIMVNGKFASMIVKNIPTDDSVNNASMGHILTTLIDSLDTKLLAFQRANLLRQTSRELGDSSDRLNGVVSQHQNFISHIKRKFSSEVQAQAGMLQINKSQQEYFESICDKLLAEFTQTYSPVGKEAEVLDCLRLSLAVVLNDLRE